MGLIEAAVVGVVGVIGAALSRLMSDEIRDWTPEITRWLIRRAASKAPVQYRERLLEEWSSYVNDTPGIVGKLIQAIGLQIAAPKLTSPLRSEASPEEPSVDDILASIRRVQAEDAAREAVTAKARIAITAKGRIVIKGYPPLVSRAGQHGKGS